MDHQEYCDTKVDAKTKRIRQAAKRLPPITRREKLSKEIILIAREEFGTMTRESIARRCGVSVGLINHYFGDMAKLRADFMAHAVSTKDIKTIALGLGVRDSVALGAPESLRKRAAALLVGTPE